MHGGGQASPLAGDRGVEGQRLEGGLDDAQSHCAASALVLVACDQDAEVKLGETRGTDGPLESSGVFGADQHRGVEHCAHLRERVGEVAGEVLEPAVERRWRPRVPDLAQLGPADPLASTGGAEVRHGPAGDSDRELLARLGPPEHFGDVVAELLLRDHLHVTDVVELLPTELGYRLGVV